MTHHARTVTYLNHSFHSSILFAWAVGTFDFAIPSLPYATSIFLISNHDTATNKKLNVYLLAWHTLDPIVIMCIENSRHIHLCKLV